MYDFRRKDSFTRMAFVSFRVLQNNKLGGNSSCIYQDINSSNRTHPFDRLVQL